MSWAHQIPSPINDLQAHVTDGIYHRREASVKTKAMKPLLTREPLPQDREKKQVAPPQKKRKRAQPTRPALSFHPRSNAIPSGRQDTPLSPPVISRPSASESSTSSVDEPQTAPFSDHETRDQSYDPQHGHDAHKRPRIFPGCFSIGQPTPSYPATPSTDMNDMNSVPSDFYDSPVSYTSSSSPALSDQSHTGVPEFAAVQVADYTHQAQAHSQMYPYDSQVYVQPSVVRHECYGYAMDSCEDRPGQGYPMQYFDHASSYARAEPHNIPAYTDNTSYPYPPGRC
ncbi:hypothetical protein BS17DRAFT_783250 [Gyrodon lividus]|nr:hypothetical protein BS17DRAFT_783250 [Gyrodon lividus]